MILKGANYLDENFHMCEGDLQICDGKIWSLGKNLSGDKEETVVDCQGLTIVPGFIDVHVHGCNGANICDGTREAVDTMAEFLIHRGITSFCPTTVTAEKQILEKALLAAKECMEKPFLRGASVLGVHMEGPFLSEGKIGAQITTALEEPSVDLFRYYNELSGGAVKLISIAPERPGGYEFIEKVKEECTVSVAHTCAGYEEAKKAFDCGATHATHLFNAMTGLHHRDPGVVGAVFENSQVRAELICDGVHIHPAVLRIVFSMMGERTLIVSDSMRAAGMPDGEGFEQGGQIVTVKNGKAILEDGTLAGSVTDIHSEIKNLVSFGIPFEQAVKSATLIPAKAIGMENELGSIQIGKRADLVLLDETLEIAGVYLAGQRIV